MDDLTIAESMRLKNVLYVENMSLSDPRINNAIDQTLAREAQYIRAILQNTSITTMTSTPSYFITWAMPFQKLSFFPL